MSVNGKNNSSCTRVMTKMRQINKICVKVTTAGVNVYKATVQILGTCTLTNVLYILVRLAFCEIKSHKMFLLLKINMFDSLFDNCIKDYLKVNYYFTNKCCLSKF